MEYNITYREKNKKLQCIISYKNNDGIWKQKTKQGFTTQKSAKPWIEETVKDLEKTLIINLSDNYKDLTFKKYRDMYIKDIDQYLEYTTVSNSEIILKRFSRLDDMILKDIKLIHIQECVNDFSKEGLHPNSIKNYIGKLKAFFNTAIKYKIIASNPIDGDINYPKSKVNNKAKALNKAELETLLSKLYPDKDYYIALIAATCGLRGSEILGLTLPNIDLDGAKIHVRQQWKELSKGVWGLGELKSKHSYRTVPIPPKTVTALREYLSFAVIDTNKRIFLDKNFNRTTSRLSRKFRKLGFDNTAHDLRHTYASLLIFNGIDIKTGATLMGHTPQMFIKTYSHFNDDMMIAATNKINTMF